MKTAEKMTVKLNIWGDEVEITGSSDTINDIRLMAESAAWSERYRHDPDMAAGTFEKYAKELRSILFPNGFSGHPEFYND